MLTYKAVELLQKVKVHILEDPRRLCMSQWIVRKNDYILSKGISVSEFPACGTVGCIAGWVVLFTDGMETRPNYVEDRAAEILGLEIEDETDELFYTSYWPETECEAWRNSSDNFKKAELVAQRIDNFIDKYRERIL